MRAKKKTKKKTAFKLHLISDNKTRKWVEKACFVLSVKRK